MVSEIDKKLIHLNKLILVLSNDEEETDWNWDAGIPHYPTPRYHNDEIDFFPRIIGGTPAARGEFPAKVSVQSRQGHHMCGGALIGKLIILNSLNLI